MTAIDPYVSPAGLAGHSSTVRLELVMHNRIIPLAKVGPTLAVLAGPDHVESGPADLLLYVDGVPRKWAIEILPHESGSLRLPIRQIA